MAQFPACCGHCNQAITSTEQNLVDVQAEYLFHKDCFMCNKCNQVCTLFFLAVFVDALADAGWWR